MPADGGERLIHPAGDDWRSYGGFRFKEVGLARFIFQSRSNPEQEYTVDLHEAPYCSCWQSVRNATRTTPRLCCHLQVIRQYMKKLAEVMNRAPGNLLVDADQPIRSIDPTIPRNDWDQPTQT